MKKFLGKTAFFIGWFIAYLLDPLVKFLQFKMHLRSRTLSIIVAFVFVGIFVTGVFFFIIPPMVEQFERLGPLILKYLNQQSASGDFSAMIKDWLNDHREKVMEFLKSKI